MHCLSFSPDSTILLTGCTIGNIRISYMDNESDEPDCIIDAAHDMGVLSTDFCKLYHSDREFCFLLFDLIPVISE